MRRRSWIPGGLGLVSAALLAGLLGSASPGVPRGEPPARPLGAPFCSISLSLFDRAPGDTYLLGSFTDRVVEATAGPVRPAVTSRNSGPAPTGDTIWGQRMRVTGAGGWGADAVHDVRRSYEQEVVLVVWGYDPRCSLIHYQGALPAGIPGEEALVVARLRDPRHWIDGLPTLDTFWGGLMVYPGRALSEGRAFEESEWRALREPPGERRPSLSAAEAFDLMGMLPQPCEEVRDPLSFAAKSAIVRTSFVEDERTPVSHVLRSLEVRARDSERRRSMCLADPRQIFR